MNTEELHEYIRASVLADAELKKLAEIGNDSAIADALRVKLPAVAAPGTYIGERGIFSLLGLVNGEIFLSTIEQIAAGAFPQSPTFARVVRWLRDPIGLDVGSPLVQGTLLSMRDSGTLSAEIVDALVAFGSVPPSLHFDEVSAALSVYRPEGQVGPIHV